MIPVISARLVSGASSAHAPQGTSAQLTGHGQAAAASPDPLGWPTAAAVPGGNVRVLAGHAGRPHGNGRPAANERCEPA